MIVSVPGVHLQGFFCDNLNVSCCLISSIWLWGTENTWLQICAKPLAMDLRDSESSDNSESSEEETSSPEPLIAAFGKVEELKDVSSQNSGVFFLGVELSNLFYRTINQSNNLSNTSKVGMTLLHDHSGKLFGKKKPTIKDIIINQKVGLTISNIHLFCSFHVFNPLVVGERNISFQT